MRKKNKEFGIYYKIPTHTYRETGNRLDSIPTEIIFERD